MSTAGFRVIFDLIRYWSLELTRYVLVIVGPGLTDIEH